jgi:hypothetical protein
MRLAGVLGVLLLVVSPVLGSPVVYTFNTTGGSVVLNVAGQGSTGGGLAGWFGVYMNSHAGEGGDFGLRNFLPDHVGDPNGQWRIADASLLANSAMKLSLAGLATATLNPNSARFLDFGSFRVDPNYSGADPNVWPTGKVGTPLINTDVYVEATVFVTGLTTTTFSTKTWAKFAAAVQHELHPVFWSREQHSDRDSRRHVRL